MRISYCYEINYSLLNACYESEHNASNQAVSSVFVAVICSVYLSVHPTGTSLRINVSLVPPNVDTKFE